MSPLTLISRISVLYLVYLSFCCLNPQSISEISRFSSTISFWSHFWQLPFNLSSPGINQPEPSPTAFRGRKVNWTNLIKKTYITLKNSWEDSDFPVWSFFLWKNTLLKQFLCGHLRPIIRSHWPSICVAEKLILYFDWCSQFPWVHSQLGFILEQFQNVWLYKATVSIPLMCYEQWVHYINTLRI